METQPEIKEGMVTSRLLSKEYLESSLLNFTQTYVTYAIVRTSKHHVKVALFFNFIEKNEGYDFCLVLDDEVVAQSVSLKQPTSICQLYDEGIKAAKEYLGSLHQGETLIELLNVSPDEWRILNEKRDRNQREYEKYVRDLYYEQNNVSIWKMPIENAFTKILAIMKKALKTSLISKMND